MAQKRKQVTALVLGEISKQYAYLQRPVYPHDVAEWLPVQRCVRSLRNDFHLLERTGKIKRIGQRKGYEPVHFRRQKMVA